MTISQIDPETALIVVDLQKGLIGYPFVHPIADVLRHTRTLLKVFRARGLTVVLVNVTGAAPGRAEQRRRLDSPLPSGFADLIDDLDRQPDDLVVTKQSWGAFATTDLEARLKAAGVTQVVICGIATGTGVEATARQAYELGFNVTLVSDAMTDTRAETHEYSLNHVFPRLGERGTASEIMTALDTKAA